MGGDLAIVEVKFGRNWTNMTIVADLMPIMVWGWWQRGEFKILRTPLSLGKDVARKKGKGY